MPHNFTQVRFSVLLERCADCPLRASHSGQGEHWVYCRHPDLDVDPYARIIPTQGPGQDDAKPFPAFCPGVPFHD